ncbi:class I SAM-dependent methyltransferase [Christiangramia salexigens]
MLKSQEKIEVTDFGAGSRVFNSNLRPVRDIAKNAGINYKRSKLLLRLTKYLDINNALELGTSLGLASSAIGANRTTSLTTIEGCRETATIASRQFKKYELNNIELKTEPFGSVLDELLKDNPKFDLIYFDGNHQKTSTLEYFELLLPTAHNDSVFIFDDIYWSPEMKEAWEEIIAHPQVQVSIDTFHWGIIFFRKQQAKQHFKIRL